MLKTKVVGVELIVARMPRIGVNAHMLAAAGVEEAAKTLKEAVEDIIPIDTGVLERSGEQDTELTRTGASATVTYGKGVPYAVSVHEDLTKRHGQAYNDRYADAIAKGLRRPRRPQEQAKFMERPLLDTAVQRELFERIKKEFQPEELVNH